MDLHSYWDKKKKIPGTKSTVSICPLVRNKIEMLTKMYFTVCPVYTNCAHWKKQCVHKVAVRHLPQGWSQHLQDRASAMPCHVEHEQAWLALVSNSLKLRMTFKFWALSRRLGEVYLAVPFNLVHNIIYCWYPQCHVATNITLS